MRTEFKLMILLVTAGLITSCGGGSMNHGPSYQPSSISECKLSPQEKEELNIENYEDSGENPFVKVKEEQLSTFAVDADGASYSNTRRFLLDGQLPPKESVRMEEYINYFTFNYDEPADGENVALNAEISTCPWNTKHHLMRIGIKGKTISETDVPNSNYVFLVDVSGSMEGPDRLELLKSGLIKMTDGLGDNDQVAIVTYAGNSDVVLQSTKGSEKEKIKKAIQKLGANGSTNGEGGIHKAYEIASKNFLQGGNNRVILGTDGDFNVGTTSTDELVSLITEKRKSGIFLTTLGFGRGNLNDHMMEQLADKGNGNYEYIDNADQLNKVFVLEKSKFHTVAKDCKIQIKFNQNMVESYRLIGYENRRLANQDFKNDSIDAGEIGSSQTITAIYEVVLKKGVDHKEYASLDFRYKMPDGNTSKVLTQQITQPPVDITSSSENMRFAASVSGFGLLMKQSAYKGLVSKQMIVDLGINSISFDPNGHRKEFIELVKKVNL